MTTSAYSARGTAISSMGSMAAQLHRIDRAASIATPGARGSNSLPSREPNRNLQPLAFRGSGGFAGVVERLLAENSRIRRGMTALYDMTAAADWQLEAVDGETAEEAFSRYRLDEILRSRLTMDAEDRDGGGWLEFLRSTATRYAYGFALYEVRAAIRGDQRWVECFPVHQSSVAGWNLDRSGRVDSVAQSTQYGRATIPGERLLHLTYGSQGPGDVEGQSLLRPLVFPHESYRAHWQAVARRSLSDGGVLIATEPERGSSAEDRAEMLGYMREFDAGDRQSLIMPHGWQHTIQFPAGSSGGALEVMRYVDALVDMALYQSQQALGATAGTGSRALGESLEDADTVRLRQMLVEHARLLSARLLPMIQALYGLPGRCPSLVAVSVDEQEQDAGETVETMATAAQAGLIRVTPEIQSTVSEALGVDMHDPDCGCAVHAWADAPVVDLVDARGRQHQHYRDYHSVEAAVSWVDGIAERAEIDARYESRLSEMVAALRGDMLSAARRSRGQGATLGQWYGVSMPIQDRYRRRVEGLLAEYESAIRRMVSRMASEEAAQQAARGMLAPAGDGAPESAVDGWRQTAVSVEVAERRQAAIAIIGRVSSEVQRWVVSGQPLDEFAPRGTVAGLFAEARGVGNAVEAEARVTEIPEGMVIAEVIRSSMLDGRVCAHCRGEDGRTWVMPEDAEDLRVTEVPDSGCEGGRGRCRCVLLVRYAMEAP